MSAPLFWDDDAAPKCLVVRLAKHSSWEWSGAFELQEREDYFGLRIHRLSAAGVRDGVTVILPVSIAVEPSGVVLVSFKSQQNLPPYCIRNACTSVAISVSQVLVRPPLHLPSLSVHNVALNEPQECGPVRGRYGSIQSSSICRPADQTFHMLRQCTQAAYAGCIWERVQGDGFGTVPEQLEPGKEVPFAWDEPMCSHTLKITAAAHNGASGSPEDDVEASTVLDIDKLPTKQVDPLVVKTRAASLASGVQDLRSRVEGVLAGTVVRVVRCPPSRGFRHASLH